MPPVEGPNDSNGAANDQIVRHESILTPHCPGLHVIEVAPRVATVIAVVTQQEEVAGGNDHIEGDCRWLHPGSVRPGG
jgi:hypothetical protein